MIDTRRRGRTARALYELHSGPNMTPMVDVVMVILIFFMASAAMLGPEWFLRTSLPVVAPSADATPPVRLRLRLVPGVEGPTHALASINDDPARDLPLDQARALLEAQAQSRGERLVVLVEPAANVPYADVVRVHEWCAELGIARVALVDPAAPGVTPPEPAGDGGTR